ncbi:MAG: MurR/RpiR family transcriptional regulator, partial [Woeseiaceae bacterium]|nr:MurR/RpiR family transcriptional regulator [Woeseiaceae bacterium]
PDSPLAADVDVLLPCRVIEDTSVYTPMSSRLAQLALLDALQIGLALAIGENAVTRLRDAKRALAEVKAKPA